MSASFDCSQRNPFRRPHWRWERALMDAALRDPDPWVSQAAALRRDVSEGLDDDALYEAHSRIYPAYELWRARSGRKTDVNFVLELEARLLIRGVGLDAIGQRMGLEPGDVEAYEALFFAVRDRLDRPSYIVQQVIGERLHAGNLRLGQDRGVFWKIYAYTLGATALDRMIDTIRTDHVPVDYADVSTALRSVGDDNLVWAYALASQSLDPTDKFKQPEAIAAYHKARELSLTGGGQAGNQAVVANVSAMLAIIQNQLEVPDYGTSGSASALNGPQLDAGAVELRSEEAAGVAAGRIALSDIDMPPGFPSLHGGPAVVEANP